MSEAPQEVPFFASRGRVQLPTDVAYGVDCSSEDPAEWTFFGKNANVGKLGHANMRSAKPPAPEPRPKAP